MEKKKDKPKKEWIVSVYEHPHNQCGGDDYGVLAIKFVECLTIGKSLDTVDIKSGTYWRKSRVI